MKTGLFFEALALFGQSELFNDDFFFLVVVSRKLGVLLGVHVNHRLVKFFEGGQDLGVFQSLLERILQFACDGWVHALGAANAEGRIGYSVVT